MRKFIGLALTALLAGIGSNASAQTCIPNGTTIAADTTWSGTVVLEGIVFVGGGATLTINPGTTVRGWPRSGPLVTNSISGTPGSLIVTHDGILIAEGGPNPNDVIIFTTAAMDVDEDGLPDDLRNAAGAPGADGRLDGFICGTDDVSDFYDNQPRNAPLSPLAANGNSNVTLWGGVVIAGNAPTNLANGDGLGAGRGIIEGPNNLGITAETIAYGGELCNDSSGRIRYVSIRHAGESFDAADELNGLTLAGVGRGTVIEFVEIYANYDDGIEWFGGCVDTGNLVVSYVGDDSFDTDQGQTGVHQELFTVASFFNTGAGQSRPFGENGGADKLGEWDGEDGGNLKTRLDQFGVQIADPLSNFLVYNLTGLGTSGINANSANGTVVSPIADNPGIQMRNNFAGEIRNSLVVNTGTGLGLQVTSAHTCPDTEYLDGYGDRVRSVTSTYDDVAGPGARACPGAGAALDAICNGDQLSRVIWNLNSLSSNIYNDLRPWGTTVNNNQCTGGAGTAANWNGLVDETPGFDPIGVVATTPSGGNVLPLIVGAPLFNPRAQGGAGSIGTFPATEPGTFQTSYRGAFPNANPGELWTEGWTVLNIRNHMD